jgi:glutamate racemase
VGGLTVLRALVDALPQERFVYLGDTARLPYGTKTPETVRRYALSASSMLVDQGVKALVVACNTASAFALPELQKAFAPIPVLGVIEPGARATCASREFGGVLVLATESTVRGGAYDREILARRSQFRVFSRACPLLVTLAEEGRVDHPITRLVIADYLRGLHSNVHTVVLGCTHFPIFREQFREQLGATVRLVDSTSTTASAVVDVLKARDLLQPDSTGQVVGDVRLLATDGLLRFRRLSGVFFGRTVDHIELVDLS